MKKLILWAIFTTLAGLCYSKTAFGPQQIISTDANSASSVYSIDLDNDGDNDVLSASSEDDKIAWYENDGNGGFGIQQIISTNAVGANNVFSIDLDNDGDNDVLYASYENDIIAWYENDGSGGFGDEQIITLDADGPSSVYSIDLDNDGDNDVLSASRGVDKIAWYENDGSGAFGIQQIITLDAVGANSVYSIDLDNDGDNDVLSASYEDDKITWYENDGSGGFSDEQIITLDAVGANSVYSIDLDNDGDNDVLSASYGDDKIAWYENLFNQVYTYNVEICDGDSLMINGEWISSQGVYTSTFTTVFGGDSIVTINLSIMPVPGDFEIIGPYEVDEFATETYSVPVNTNVEYGFEVENGNILEAHENSVEVQWASNSMGLVKATATSTETGCNTESVLEVTIGTGDIDEFSQFKIKLYPNPANKTLFIESEVSQIHVEITNNLGQLVLKSDRHELDISGLESNIYSVKVFDKHDKILRNEKLVIAR